MHADNWLKGNHACTESTGCRRGTGVRGARKCARAASGLTSASSSSGSSAPSGIGGPAPARLRRALLRQRIQRPVRSGRGRITRHGHQRLRVGFTMTTSAGQKVTVARRPATTYKGRVELGIGERRHHGHASPVLGTTKQHDHHGVAVTGRPPATGARRPRRRR